MARIDVSRIIENQRLSPFLLNLLFWLTVVMFFDGYNTQAISYAAPSIMRDWQVGRTTFGLIFSIGFVGTLTGGIGFSLVSDRLGRKPMIVVTAALFGVLTMATGFADNLTELICLRFLAGLAIGGLTPVAVALAIEFAPKRFRATFATIVTTGYILGTSAGGIVAKYLMPAHGWQVIFTVGGGLSLIVTICLMRWLPESLRYLAINRQDPRRIAQLAAKIGGREAASTNAEYFASDEEATNSRTLRGIRRVRMLFVGRLHFITSLLWLACMLSSIEANSLMNWLPTLAEADGMRPTDAVLALTWFSMAGLIASLLLMRFLDRFGSIALTVMPLLASPVIGALSIGNFPLTATMTIFFAAGFFVMGGHFGLSAVCGVVYPSACRANGYAMTAAAGRFGGIIGPAAGGLMMDAGLPAHRIFLIYAIFPIFLATALLCLGLQHRALMRDERETLIVLGTDVTTTP